jgi:hypothetical protein
MSERPLLLVLVPAAFSAGVHLALAPSHARESELLGVAFAASAVALACVAFLVFARPDLRGAPPAAALLLAGLVAAYLASRSVGLPGVGHHREPFDAVGLVTKGAELVALLAALHIFLANRRWPRPLPDTKEMQ